MNENSSLSFKNIFRRETKLASYIVICLTIVVLSLSYAMFFQVDSNSKNQVVTAGDLKFTYSNGSQITSSANTKCFEPMSSDEALLYFSDCSYQFSVQNTGSLKASYTLKLIANAANTIETSKLKVILKKKVGETLEVVSGFPKTLSELAEGVLLTDEMNPKDVLVFSAQIYVDEATSIESDTSKTVSFQIEGTGVVHEDAPISTNISDAILSCNDSAVNCLKSNSNLDQINLEYDKTSDNNLRYVGANPNNYVKFNNELWRIIGVMNNVSDQDANMLSQLKIIKATPYKTDVAWDGNNYNNWNTSSIKDELNSTYYETLSNKDMIATTMWNLGTSNNYSSASDGLASHFYEYERGTIVAESRPTLWLGDIALMYPSDYGFATNNASSENRTNCLNKELINWGSLPECFQNNWLYNSYDQWTLIHDPSMLSTVLAVNSSGNITPRFAYEGSFTVSPTLYLKTNVKITNGNGTEENPYILSL